MNLSTAFRAPIILFSLFLTAGVSAALAQEEVPRADAKRDWGVYSGGEPKECWIVSAPKKSEARRGGKKVTVRRGDIMLMVSVRPSDGVKNEVSFEAGYPIRKDSTVNMRIGTESFELFIDGETAWPASPDEDAKVITAMRRGSSAVVTGLSQRGTTTVDTFSLLGFTAALESAQAMCK
ncbi:MAG: invasion associated locus B family protein [Paracoccaceae bacterium]